MKIWIRSFVFLPRDTCFANTVQTVLVSEKNDFTVQGIQDIWKEDDIGDWRQIETGSIPVVGQLHVGQVAHPVEEMGHLTFGPVIAFVGYHVSFC